MKENVIISCVPKLNIVQQTGMLKLLRDIERLGYKSYLWTDYDYETLSGYKLDLNVTLNGKLPLFVGKIFKKFGFSSCQRQVVIDEVKWKQRLRRWLNIEDNVQVEHQYKHFNQQALNIFETYKPSFFLCWNPFCCRYGIAYDVARTLGIETGAIEWGFLPETFLLDKEGTLAHSSIFKGDIWRLYSEVELLTFRKSGEEIFEGLQSQSLSLYSQGKVEIPAECLYDEPMKTKILVLAIDEIDAGAYPSGHLDREGLLPFHKSSVDQAKAIANASEEYRVILKPHPSHNLYPNNQQLAKNCWIVNGNPDLLIDWADVIFCAGSKMEFSALLKGKPLINFGAGLLYGKGCAFEINHVNDIEKVVEQANRSSTMPSAVKNFKQFLGFLKLDYLYSYGDSDCNKSTLKKILPNHQNSR